MVEVTQPVDSIMAVETALTELIEVNAHEFIVIITVTIDARLEIGPAQLFLVTTGASQTVSGIIFLMPYQAEIR